MTRNQLTTTELPIPMCGERARLAEKLLIACRELLELQSQQIRALIDDDAEFSRFDDLLHVARERKDNAKYALIGHIDEHRC